MRFLFVVATAAVLSVTPAAAQDGPTVEVRLKSVNDMLDYAEYIGGLIGQGEQAKQGAGFVRAMAGPKGIEGVDPKRPFGLYASVTKNFPDSPVVAMIPVADEEAFLGLLRGKLSLDPKKGDDGVYALDAPNVPATVYFTFANEYVYATIRDKKAIGAKALADPKAFFSKDDPAVASVAVHLDRVPADIRKYAFSLFELQLNQEKGKKNPSDTPSQHKLKGLLLDGFAAGVNAVVTDGKALTVRVLVDPKADELTLDMELTAAGGSELGKAVEAVTGRKGLAVAAAAVKNPVVAGAVNVGLPAGMVEKLGPALDEVFKDAVEAAKPEDREAAKKVLDALAPTIKSGEAEFGGAMTGPDAAGHYKVVFAVRVKEGAGIEKTAREFAPFVADKVTAEFDAGKAAGKPLHKLVAKDPKGMELFGTDTSWWVIGDDIVILGFEPDGAEAKRVAGTDPAAGAVVRFELSAAAAATAFETQLGKDEVKKVVSEAFDGKSPAGKDTVLFTVTGGEKLTGKLVVKGGALKVAVALDNARKKGE